MLSRCAKERLTLTKEERLVVGVCRAAYAILQNLPKYQPRRQTPRKTTNVVQMLCL